MSRTKNEKQAAPAPSGVTVAVEILKKHRGPMKVVELARAVVASGRAVNMKGATPEATISAHVYVDAKREGGRFVKVGRGVVDLRERVARRQAKEA